MSVSFRGCFTVCVTPFTSDGSSVDLTALKGFLEWQVDVGVPGVILLGTTGEFLTVSDEERRALVTTAVQVVAKRAIVLVGTMSAYTPTAVRYSKEAQDLGADGLMIVPPYYYTPTDEEIVRYYEAISKAVDVPIMLYNNPVTSNVDMSAELVARLTLSFENIQYIKESSRDIARVRDVIEATEGKMNVFAGERAVDSFILGAIGYVNPYGNYAPYPSRLLWDLYVTGRVEEARRIQRVLDRIDRTIAAGHPTYGHQCYSKRLAAAAGHAVGDVRPPLTTFANLGTEGEERLAGILPLLHEVEEMAVEIVRVR